MMNTHLARDLRHQTTVGFVLLGIWLLSSMATPVMAEPQGSAGTSSDGWKFTAAPYLLIPWMDGKVAVRGLDHEVDVSPGSIFKNLQFGGMGYFEARKGSWGTGIDAVYMALGSTVARPSANVDFNQGAYTFVGLRRLNEKVDALFGVRWNVLQGKLDFKGPILQGTYEQTKQWVNPIVGIKLKQPLAGPLNFSFEGDIGGFGAGSDFAWNLFPTFGVDVSKKASVHLGYRVLSEDYDTGSGNQYFKYDVITQALAFGISIHF